VAKPDCQGIIHLWLDAFGRKEPRCQAQGYPPRASLLNTARHHGMLGMRMGDPRQEYHIPHLRRGALGDAARTFIQIHAAAEQDLSRFHCSQGDSILGNGSQQSSIVSNHLQSSTVPSADMGERYAAGSLRRRRVAVAPPFLSSGAGHRRGGRADAVKMRG
jgi:hypothetical protein